MVRSFTEGVEDVCHFSLFFEVLAFVDVCEFHPAGFAAVGGSDSGALGEEEVALPAEGAASDYTATRRQRGEKVMNDC